VSNNLLEYLYRLIKLTVIGISLTLLCAYDRGEGIELMRPVAFINRLLRPATDLAKTLGKPLTGGGIAGIEFEGFLELGLAAGKIPTVFELDAPQNGMRVGECGIEFQGLRGGRTRLGCDVVGVLAITAEHVVSIRQSRVCQCITGVFIDSLIEVGDCRLDV